MKRILLFIISIALFAACEKNVTETPELKDAGVLEVSFAYNGAPVRVVEFSPAGQTAEIEVMMNNDNVKWRVTADSDWCIVDEEKSYSGTDTFSVSLMSNDGFLDRDDATITLHAGDYTTNLLVKQEASVFSVNKAYSLSNSVSGSETISVRVVDGVEWEVDCPQWIRMEKGDIQEEEGGKVIELTLIWDTNEDSSRYGTVNFRKADQQEILACFSVWQFGHEYETTQDGTVMVAAQNPSPVEIRVPDNVFESIACPQWIVPERVDNEGDTESVYLYFQDNPSDAEKMRSAEVRLVSGKSDMDVVAPIINQHYYSLGELISADGLELFAERFNSGGDVSGWVTNGKVKVSRHIDMSEVDDWMSIGTAERPFNMTFDGGSRNISGFVSDTPLFGVCKDAVISDVIFDETCKFIKKDGFGADCSVAALAAKTINTSIIGCESKAEVQLTGSASADKLKVYMGGMVAYAGEGSHIKDCLCAGSISLPNTVKCTDGFLYLGGFAGYLSGKVENCRNEAKISDAAIIKEHYVGGITGFADEKGEISGCKNFGAVQNSSGRNSDASRYVFLGGLVGRSKGNLINLTNEGRVELDSNVKSLYSGGIVGQVDAGTISGLVSNGGYLSSRGAGRYVCVGGLIGYLNMNLQLDFTNVAASSYDMSLLPVEINVRAGGIVGYVYQSKELSLIHPVVSGNITFDISGGNQNDTEDDTASIGGLVGMVDADASVTVDNASISGAIVVNVNKANTNKGTTALGGAIGASKSGVTVTDSTNDCEIKWTINCARSNAAQSVAGGIVGRIERGLSVISGCTNNASIANLHWNNNGWSDRMNAAKTGGIIGYYGNFDNLDSETDKITITDCYCTADIIALRGLVGGIAGFLINARVSGCSFTGKCSQASNNPLVGGIAAGLQSSSVSDCKVLAPLYSLSGGSCDSRAGGIVAYLRSGSTIENCMYNGKIHTGDNGEKEVYFGGIAADAEAGCSISGCGVGGSILGTILNNVNFSQYIVGNGGVEAIDCVYWEGE